MRHKAQQRAKQAAGAAAAAASQSATPAAADPAATATDAAKDDSEGARATGGVGAPGAAAAGASEVVYDPDAAACITGLAVWVVRYCKQLWVSMAAKLSHIEVGQVLGHHFSEAAQVNSSAQICAAVFSCVIRDGRCCGVAWCCTLTASSTAHVTIGCRAA